MRILISGYYGFGNAGDEAILAGTLDGLRRRVPDCELAVLSNDPAATRGGHGVQAEDRWDKAAVWRAIGWADLVLQGGGGLLQDATSAKSAAYYLAILEAATWRRTPYAFYAQGIGPLTGSLARLFTGRAARKAAAITVRDEASADLLVSLGVDRERVLVAADPAPLAEPSPPEDVAHLLPPASEGPRLGLALRDVSGCEALVDGALRAAGELSAEASIVPLALHRPVDARIAERVAAEAGGRVVGADDELSPQRWIGLVRSLDLVVAMRLHSAIFAAAQGVDFVALSYDPKVAAFAESVDATWLDRSASEDEVVQVISDAWADRDASGDSLETRADRLRAAAERNLDMVEELITRFGL